MAQYAWKRTPRGAPKAGVAGKYIARLSRTHGGISTEVLVEESRPADAVLHNCFEWNDRAAAEQYRRVQAGTLLRSLQVVIQESDDAEPIRVNAFVHLEEEREYFPVQVVMNNKDKDERYKTILLEDLRQLRNKCKAYQEFAEVCQAIGKIRIR